MTTLAFDCPCKKSRWWSITAIWNAMALQTSMFIFLSDCWTSVSLQSASRSNCWGPLTGMASNRGCWRFKEEGGISKQSPLSIWPTKRRIWLVTTHGHMTSSHSDARTGDVSKINSVSWSEMVQSSVKSSWWTKWFVWEGSHKPKTTTDAWRCAKIAPVH